MTTGIPILKCAKKLKKASLQEPWPATQLQGHYLFPPNRVRIADGSSLRRAEILRTIRNRDPGLTFGAKAIGEEKRPANPRRIQNAAH